MTVIVEDDQQPGPHKMMQLASYQSRRRLSTSWTENLDPPSEQKSPLSVKSPDSKTGSTRSFFPRSTEVHPYLDEEVRLQNSSDVYKRVTDFTAFVQSPTLNDEAGKVLEDVHDRLIEDHSSAAVAPVMSPETLLHDQTSTVDMDESISIDDRVKSPTLSQSSKRTSTSAELKASMRTKLRKQEGPTEGELKSVDEQIERALEIGARFLHEQASMNPPDDVQYSFFVGDEDQVATYLLKYLKILFLYLNSACSAVIMQKEDTLYNYVKAEAWKTFLHKFEGSDYTQLDLFLSVIYFEQHPLIGNEDKFDLRLRIRYDEQCQRINDMTDVLMDAESLPISENASNIREHAEALYNDVRKVSDELLSEYAELENCRNRQGYTTSPLKYCLSDDDENRCAPDLTHLASSSL
ncbi:unnamed protein product [Angiostrongylus costaricensis]|uniref:Rab-GAP TBC domain-containing protein n=1 Tax=Angiostrongylus costaricensis TaxID=334426 RepID=A0A0R3PFW7_ANGCS|nr:unnamed protein product [Angiostrongylus costaricensis]